MVSRASHESRGSRRHSSSGPARSACVPTQPTTPPVHTHSDAIHLERVFNYEEPSACRVLLVPLAASSAPSEVRVWASARVSGHPADAA